MDLSDLQQHWDALGHTDPMWAILTDPERRGNKWDEAEFFASGRQEIEAVLERVRGLRLRLKRGRALDFGCGLGRLTQALGQHFAEAHGVDIAASMIEGARRYNQLGDRVNYYVNSAADLRLFPDRHFDLIYSVVVLQHMQPTYSRRYIAEFVRTLAPGGWAVFQIPAGPAAPEELRPPLQDRPLPRGAFECEIRPGVIQLSGDAGERIEVEARVRNSSPVTWLAGALPDERYRIQLGNHWRTAAGHLLVLNDGRAPLPQEMKPGEAVTLQLPVQLPSKPGSYVLELDLVQEGLRWFERPAQVQVTVSARMERERQGAELQPSLEPGVGSLQALLEPFMEMYSLPRKEVFEIVDRAGGRVRHLFDDRAEGGLETIYYVSR